MRKRKIKIGGIIQKRNLIRIGIMSFPHRPDAVSAIFRALGGKGVNCPFIVHTVGEDSLDSIVTCAALEDLPAVRETIDAFEEGTGAKAVAYDREVGIVSIFGPHFGEEPGIAGEMLTALASGGINLLAISCSISTLSCLIRGHDMDAAVSVLEKTFELP